MDKLYFAAHLAAYNRETNRRVIPFLGLLLLSLLGTLIWLPRGHAASDSSPFALLPFLSTFVIFLIATVRITKRALKKHHLTCPFCNGVWTDTVSRQIVMATGHCGHCGNRVLTEE